MTVDRHVNLTLQPSRALIHADFSAPADALNVAMLPVQLLPAAESAEMPPLLPAAESGCGSEPLPPLLLAAESAEMDGGEGGILEI